MHDLPAMLGYVLKKTGVAKVQYMGHSMGTMAAFAQFSLNHDLADKVRPYQATSRVHETGAD